MKPTVGRIVHWFSSEIEEPRAAIVTRVHTGDDVDLTIFWPPDFSSPPHETVSALHRVPRDTPSAAGFWRWPAREP